MTAVAGEKPVIERVQRWRSSGCLVLVNTVISSGFGLDFQPPYRSAPLAPPYDRYVSVMSSSNLTAFI